MLRTRIRTVANSALTPSLPHVRQPAASTQPSQLLAQTTRVARQQRALSTTTPPAATYRRFGEPSPSPGQGRPAQQYNTLQELREHFQQQQQQQQKQGGRPPQFRRRRGWMGDYRVLIAVVGAGGVYYVVHLEQVPETGRWRFVDVSPAQEQALGQQEFQKVLAEYRARILPPNHPTSQHVRRVASRIVAALDKAVTNQPEHMRGSQSEAAVAMGTSTSYPRQGQGQGQGTGVSQQPRTEWEVFVIDNPNERNAFVLPGGKIFVFTGILGVCQNEDGLATVLGHEVAHQVARHMAEKVSGIKVIWFAGMLLEALGLDFGMSRIALTLLLSLPNSRKTELEADYIGQRIMAMACFDPREASKLWQRMEAAEGASASASGGNNNIAAAILSTHPVSSKRMQKMEEWLPGALQARAGSDCPNPDQISSFRSASSIGRF